MANIGNLYADLTTSSAAFQKDMGKAANSVRSSSAKMNKNLARLERNFYGIQRSVKRTVKNMFSLRTVTGTVAGSAGIGYAIKSSLDFADAIGKTADRIGLTTDALQKYRYAAKLSGVEQSTLDKGFEAFAKRLGEARAGTGAMVTYLRKYDKAILDTILSTKSTEEALQIMFRTMDKMTNASDRAALSAAAFSRTAGVQMANLVREGASGLNDMLREAQELGLVIDESLIRGAEEANDSVTKLSGVLKTQMVATLLELAPKITEVSDGMVGWVKANRDLIEQKVDKTIQNVSSSLDGIVNIYNSLPSGVVGAAGYGIAGKIIFGGAAGKTIAMIVLLNEQLKILNLNITSIPKKVISLDESMQNIFDVITGKKDWQTGEDLTKGPIFRGKMPQQPELTKKIIGKSGIGDTGIDYNEWVKDYIASLTDIADKSSDSWMVIERASTKAITNMEKENDAWTKDYIASLSDMVDYSSDSWMKTAKLVEEVHVKSVSVIDETYKNMLENIQGAFADTFYDIFSGQLDSFDDFANSMKNIFFRTLSEMAAKATMTKLFGDAGGAGGGVVNWVKSAFGIGSAVGGAGGGSVSAASLSGGASTGIGMAALGGLGAVGLTGYMGYKMIEAQRQRDARFLFTKMQYDKSPIDAETGLYTGAPVTKTPWEAYGAYTPGAGYTGSTEIIGKSYGRGSEKGARKPVEKVIEKIYEDTIELANFYDKLTGGKAGKAFTLTPHKEKFDIKNADKELARLAKRWGDTVWSIFDDAFEDMGFKSMDALARGIEKEKDVLGNAFQTALKTGSWLSFKSSIAEQIYNTITTDLTQALIQSGALQGALLPIYGGIEKGLTAATAGGGFDVGVFGQHTTGALSQFNTLLQPIKPAFDAMANLSDKIKSLLIGSFANGGVVPETGLAMVHKGEHISNGGGTVVINADVITTNDVDTWLAERIQRIDTLRVGKKISKVELSTAGLDI